MILIQCVPINGITFLLGRTVRDLQRHEPAGRASLQPYCPAGVNKAALTASRAHLHSPQPWQSPPEPSRTLNYHGGSFLTKSILPSSFLCPYPLLYLLNPPPESTHADGTTPPLPFHSRKDVTLIILAMYISWYVVRVFHVFSFLWPCGQQQSLRF